MTTCDYCANPAELVTGDAIYPHRPDLSGKWFWRCEPCGAYVGTHQNSKEHQPLGRLANAELRAAKVRAHAAFDPLWTQAMDSRNWSKTKARHAAYRWLADQLGIHRTDCHIGMFDVALCKRTVEACKTCPERVR